MSRSLRPHHHPLAEVSDALPTPPSSASTPPTMAPAVPSRTDDPPPKKRQRYNVDRNSVDDRATPSDVEDVGVVEHTVRPDEAKSAVRLPRIRIKMAPQCDLRISIRLSEKSGDNCESGEMDDGENSTPSRDMLEMKDDSWEDQEICEMVDPDENWRVIGLANVGNTCFTNAILQVFSQTEILGAYFIQRYAYIPPSLTTIATSADLSSRSSRSKTRRNQDIEQKPPTPSDKSLCSSFSRLLRALHPSISPPTHRLGVTYHQPKKYRTDSKYTLAPREFLGIFNSVYPAFRKGESQEDAMEFFSKVRERLHEELRADLELQLRNAGKQVESDEQWIMEKSPISDIFRGYYVTKRMCTVCNSARDAPLEETWQLPVAVPSSITPAAQSYSLPDLIAHYGGVEKDVNVECRLCGGNTPHDSRPSYLQTPRILVIQALRFVVPKTAVDQTILEIESTPGAETPPTDSSDTSLPKRRKRSAPKRKVIKNPAHITFPLKGLDMTPYLHGAAIEEEIYDLFGVVEHVGRRMDGGHYIAYVRGKDSENNDSWWKCNDAKCWMVNSDTVSAAQGYIWFYERRVQRGVTPEDWGEVMQFNTPLEKSLGGDKAGLPTPDSDEKPKGI